MAGHWSQVSERGSIWGIRAVVFVLNILGHRAASWLLFPVVLYFFLTGRKSRHASLQYLELLARFRASHELGGTKGRAGSPLHAADASATAFLGAQPAAAGRPADCLHSVHEGASPKTCRSSEQRPTLVEAFRHHYAFALTTMERVWFWQGKLDRFVVERRGRELLLARRGRGALLIGAHVGSFDALRTIGEEERIPVVVAMHRAHAANINRIFQAVSPKSDVRVIELMPRDVGGVMELKAAVEEGAMVAVLGDRLPLGGTDKVTVAPFLGRPAAFAHHPWILAHLLECPVFLTAGVRAGPRHYKLRAELLAERIELPRGNRDQAIEPFIRSYARWLENLCCDYPYQWFNFFDFWNIDEQ